MARLRFGCGRKLSAKYWDDAPSPQTRTIRILRCPKEKWQLYVDELRCTREEERIGLHGVDSDEVFEPRPVFPPPLVVVRKQRGPVLNPNRLILPRRVIPAPAVELA